MESLSYLSNADINYVEGLYEQYQQDPQNVDPSWQQFFQGFELARSRYGANGSPQTTATATSEQEDALCVEKEHHVIDLIDAYRTRGHLFADINPILPRKQYQPPLNLEQFNLSEADLDTTFYAGNEIGLGEATLRDILQLLKETYCGTIGAEFRYIRIPHIVRWVRSRMESSRNRPNLSLEEKKHILDRLGRASLFEHFIHRKFPGQKRFSLEGAESLIPALDSLILYGSELGVEEFVIGMAHRGRLNVLTNIMRKEPDNVFGEFKDKGVSDSIFDGDVKYHMGFSSDPVLPNGKQVHLSLAPNPSHLEAVNPLVEGMVRAKMENLYDSDEEKICPILIHGDASLAGQGVVYEVIQMSRLENYACGGTVHYVINNQIGFTTKPEQGRSSTYCTDVGKVTLSPVFHVNGDDPEALVHVSHIAMEFRQEFKRDVFIDIQCYRKYGHNEGDEPRFTQPAMYQAIKNHPSPYKTYSNQLIEEGAITEDDVKSLEKELNDYLNEELEQATKFEYELDVNLQRHWEGIEFYSHEDLESDPETGVELDTLKAITETVTTPPEGFSSHRNIQRLLDQRYKMVHELDALDWGMGEHMAYGSLCLEGTPVRISGQDSERGTFSHRHAVIVDQETSDKYFPLQHLSSEQAPFYALNSLLSEFGVMGFEAGYAMSAPQTLTIWEAQFGDFFNGAQVVIDQFLASATTKWRRMCGLTLFLPHGFEGLGPEHSSARIERFLELAAGNNMYVLNLSTPANIFHALRRQIHLNSRRPLVIFTPKSLLRHPLAVSPLADFGPGTKFQPLIDDDEIDPKTAERVVLTSGKLYYDLLKARRDHEVSGVALLRLEQYYPLPEEALKAALERYPNAKQTIWAQEEPENMGAWSFLFRKLPELNLQVIARKESSSPATGSRVQHESQQAYIIKKSLDLPPETEIKS